MKKLLFGITSAIVIGLLASCSNKPQVICEGHTEDEEYITVYYCRSPEALMEVIYDPFIHYMPERCKIINGFNIENDLYEDLKENIYNNVLKYTYYSNKNFKYKEGYYVTKRFDSNLESHIDYLGYLKFMYQPKENDANELEFDFIRRKSWLHCW